MPSPIVTADLHLAPATADRVWEALRQLGEYNASTGGGRDLVVCGDLLDQAKSLDTALMLELRHRLRGWDGTVWLLPGNHDQLVRGKPESTPLVLLGGDNVEVVTQPSYTPLGWMIPYYLPEDFTRIVASLKIDPTGLRVIWCHQGFKGAYRNNMNRDTDGCSLIKGVSTVITGHYHMPQNLGALIYVGSPYQQSHAETEQEKSYLAFAQVSGGMPLPERIPFNPPIGPRYWTVTWDPATEDAPGRPHGWREGDVVRVMAQATRASLRTAESRAKLARGGLEDATVVARPAERVRRPEAATSLRDALHRYLFGVHGPKPGPDPHDVIEYAKEHELWTR